MGVHTLNPYTTITIQVLLIEFYLISLLFLEDY